MTSFTPALAVAFPLGLVEGFGIALCSLRVRRVVYDRVGAGHATAP